MCVRAGSHAHAVVKLRSIEGRTLRRVAGSHLHWRNQLPGPGVEAEQTPLRLISHKVLRHMFKQCFSASVSVETPEAVVGYCPPGGANPQHWSHLPSTLAIPGPTAEQWHRGVWVCVSHVQWIITSHVTDCTSCSSWSDPKGVSLRLQLLPKQDILKRLSSLKTRTFRQPKSWCDTSQQVEVDSCAVCLEPFNNNQVNEHFLYWVSL